jgi:hypothetical protein
MTAIANGLVFRCLPLTLGQTLLVVRVPSTPPGLFASHTEDTLK